MARFISLEHNVTNVQFWFFGLDAKNKILERRGFHKTKYKIGSSLYKLNNLTLHSSGLWLEIPEGNLHYLRRAGLFYLDGKHFNTQQGLTKVEPFFIAHEAWIIKNLGKDYREKQIKAYKLPKPIKRNLILWLEMQKETSAFLWNKDLI